MSINNDNYELFFMLYVDNELSNAERQAVENFVADNEDLQQEFSELKKLVLSPDTITFDNKEELYMVGDNFQSSLLLHLDGELETNDANEMTRVIAGDKALQANWDILRLTKLDPSEKIIFTDKASLYRKERDNVFIGRFARWAVAAALIGVGFFTGLSIYKDSKQADGFVITKPSKVNQQNGNGVNGQDGTIHNKENTAAADTNEVATQKNPVDMATSGVEYADRKITKDKKENQKSSLANINQVIQQKPNQPEEVTPEENNKLLANATSPKMVTRISPEREPGEMIIAAAPKVKLNTESGDHLLTPIDMQGARTAGMNELASLENDNHILYINEDKVTRTRAGGFLKRMKRVIVRNTNIQTEKGFRIAGFEIASK